MIGPPDEWFRLPKVGKKMLLISIVLHKVPESYHSKQKVPES